MAQWTSLLPTFVRLPVHSDPAAGLPSLESRECLVEGRKARYGVVEGDGPTVIFFHGWGLSYQCYGHPLRALGGRGWRVIAPDMPGFGGTSDLPACNVTFESFARFGSRLLDEIGVEGPVGVAGHSFGGGVAVRFAHDHPDRVGAVALLDALSGTSWVRSSSRSQPLATRPFWDWGIHLLRELPATDSTSTVASILSEVAHNLIRHPATLSLTAHLARSANLEAELAELELRGVPVRAVWGESDKVVTRASFDDQCRALGIEGELVPGSHSWPMSQPARFADIVTEALSP